MELIVHIQADMQADDLCAEEESPSPGSEHKQSIELPKRPRKVLQKPTHQIWKVRGVGTKQVDVAKVGNSPISPPPLTTNVTPAKDWSERATPRAQTRYDFEESERRTRSSSLEGILLGMVVI